MGLLGRAVRTSRSSVREPMWKEAQPWEAWPGLHRRPIAQRQRREEEVRLGRFLRLRTKKGAGVAGLGAALRDDETLSAAMPSASMPSCRRSAPYCWINESVSV